MYGCTMFHRGCDEGIFTKPDVSDRFLIAGLFWEEKMDYFGKNDAFLFTVMLLNEQPNAGILAKKQFFS